MPQTRYALTDEGVAVAYQVIGNGPHDVVFSPGWVTNVEVLWEWPACVRFVSRMASRCRLVLYDKQGTGLSDRIATFPDLGARMDDIRAVMRATGMERATLFGPTQGGALSALFAATYPERVDGLILYGGTARLAWAPDYPWGTTEEEARRGDEDIAARWGTEPWAREFARDWGAGSQGEDPRFVRWFARLMRFSATPTAAIAFAQAFYATDVRHVLPTIGAPTLLMYRSDHGERDEVEATASLIPRAQVVELPADNWNLFVADPESVAAAIEPFLDGIRREEETFGRVLATVLFTDLVDSTEHAAELGDRGWRELVERHHTTIRALLGRYRGTEVDTAGDGFFATFDGPARAIRCAQAILEAVRPLGIEVRAGLHTGELESIDGKAGGIAVNIGARVGALAGASEVLVSQTVRDLVAGSGLEFEDRGEHELKGVPESWRLYSVAGG